METYPKIQTLFKRHLDGPKKGKMILGDWTAQWLEYLAGNEWEFTEKVDGTNIRVHFYLTAGGNNVTTFGGRSDNAQIPKPLQEHLDWMFPSGDEDISKWMLANDLQEVTLYGEGYGPSIQSGGKYRADVSFVLFDVKVGGFWLSRANIEDVAKKLRLDVVPLLGTGTLQDGIDIVSSGLTWDKNGKMTNWGKGIVKGGLKSQWGNFEAEGIVAKTVVPLFNNKGERAITKIKAVDFR
jgi:hypothetical protein